MSTPKDSLEYRIVKWLGLLASISFIAGSTFFCYRHLQRESRNADSIADANAAQPIVRPNQAADPGNASEESIDRIATTAKAKNRHESIQLEVEANTDTWPTEAFSDLATKKLKQWLGEVAKGNALAPDFLDADFRADALRPRALNVELQNETTTVRRWTANESNATLPLSDSLKSLSESITGKHRIYPKVVRIVQTDVGFDTTVLVEGGGSTSAGNKQWNATWDCVWESTKGNPSLKQISLVQYEEVESKVGDWLVDTTATVLRDEAAYARQLQYGMDYWVNKLEHRMHVNRLGHHGLAIGDANGDGLEDIYVCQPGGLPNRLFIHNTDGTATDASEQSGVRFLDDTTAALFADFDNDGDEDLAILTVSGGFIFSNDGTGKFELRTTMPDCRNAFSLTAADYDQDGNLDLYIGRYWPEASGRGAIPLPVPYYDAMNGGRNVLLRNDGEWKFSDVTKQAGLDLDNTRYTMAAAWEDFDNDGDQDLYVANDFGRNCCYQNNAGKFVNVAAKLSVEDTAAGMSVSWSDYDHDGRTDLYVGNMFSSAGNRITYQRQYESQFDETARKKLQRLARGNSLFRNRDQQAFEDVSVQTGVTMGRWAWGSVFVDLNNDSWDDLVIANGHVTTEDTGDL